MSENELQTVVQTVKYTWPPTEEQMEDVAVSALNRSQDKDVKVLVYWDNPTIMIFDPIHFARTDYVEKKYTCDERSVEVIIGKLD